MDQQTLYMKIIHSVAQFNRRNYAWQTGIWFNYKYNF